jgi:hypothetical protein
METMKKNNVDKTEHYNNQKIKETWKEMLVRFAFANFWKCFLLVIFVLIALVLSVRTSLKYMEHSTILNKAIEVKDQILDKFMRTDERIELEKKIQLHKDNPIIPSYMKGEK